MSDRPAIERSLDPTDAAPRTVFWSDWSTIGLGHAHVCDNHGACDDDSGNVTVGSSDTATFYPGAYNAVTIRGDATFRPGVYSFSSLRLGSIGRVTDNMQVIAGTVRFHGNGPAVIYIGPSGAGTFGPILVNTPD